VPKTAETVASQQYYGYPNGVNQIDNVYITIGDVKYPLTTIYSQSSWDTLNAITIQPSTFPQFIFPRRDDFGVWPIPQDEYDITFSYYIRDRNLLVDDYTGGTVVCTNGDATVTGTDTVFTTAMVGRWFTITNTATPGEGYWYRIASWTSATSIELENAWQDTTIAAAVAYRIGQCPEIPEEGHIILADGATADFYAGLQDDAVKATWWNNKFFTGDGNNPNRNFGDKTIMGGLIGLYNKYSNRDKSKLISRRPSFYTPYDKVWASEITE